MRKPLLLFSWAFALLILTSPPAVLPEVNGEPPADPQPGDTWVNPVDGSILVWIPGGEFTMGSEDGDQDEKPVHNVTVAGFWLGKFEVSNAQYGRFLAATNHPNPPFWDDPTLNSPDLPVLGLTWKEAKKYCQWAGLRLPTEAEWEYAAAAGRRHRFGTATGQLTRELANCRDEGRSGHPEAPAPVHSFPPNPWGIHNLAGNVWEWTSSRYQPYPYSSTDGREDLAQEYALRVMRGGAFNTPAAQCSTSYRRRFASHLRFDYVGVRVARSPRGQETVKLIEHTD